MMSRIQHDKSNPMGTQGFEFIEFAEKNTDILDRIFTQLGFRLIAHHRSKDVLLYQQGDINFIVNHEPNSFAQAFAQVHGPSVCAFGIRVADAAEAYQRAIKLGAKPYHSHVGPMEINLPAIYGIGNSLIYLIDHCATQSIYEVDFIPCGSWNPEGYGLTQIDHITHNVHQGRMDKWAEFYHKLFNFTEIRYFDIHGAKTGLKSRAMVSPCGKVRIPINEPSDNKSQIQEYLQAYHGEGIQHIALSSDDIYSSLENIQSLGMSFLSVPDTYYDMIEQRIPQHDEDIQRMHELKILIDGNPQKGMGILLQIFTSNQIGPIFFEIIQRKGNDGFGEGNFQALFEAIERDQMQRGVV